MAAITQATAVYLCLVCSLLPRTAQAKHTLARLLKSGPIVRSVPRNTMTGLLYSFVARDTTVLSEYSAIQGNFRTVAQECLLNARISDDKFTITSDAYTFNFMVSNGYSKCSRNACRADAPGSTLDSADGLSYLCAAFLVVADEAYGRQIPFAFLERIKDAFIEKYGDKGRTAAEDSLNNTFGCVVNVCQIWQLHVLAVRTCTGHMHCCCQLLLGSCLLRPTFPAQHMWQSIVTSCPCLQ